MEKKSKWVEKLEKKVLFIQSHVDCITDEREKAVLECLLDGMSMISISRHMDGVIYKTYPADQE